MNISIVIPCRNSSGTINDSLRSISSQLSTECEVIVVDCSDDDSAADIVKSYPGIKYLRQLKLFTPGVGRNIGASVATGELLVFVDADVILREQALDKIWNYYEQGYKIFDGSLELAKEKRVGISSHLEHQFFNHEYQSSRSIGKRKNLSSAFFIIEKNIFISEGGFEDIPRIEDTEFTERLAKKYGLFFIPEVAAYQIQNSLLTAVLRKIFIGGYNLYVIRYKATLAGFKRIAFVLLLPLIAFLKTTRIIVRNIRYNRGSERLWSFLLVPLIYFAGLFWVMGFCESIFFGTRVSSER